MQFTTTADGTFPLLHFCKTARVQPPQVLWRLPYSLGTVFKLMTTWVATYFTTNALCVAARWIATFYAQCSVFAIFFVFPHVIRERFTRFDLLTVLALQYFCRSFANTSFEFWTLFATTQLAWFDHMLEDCAQPFLCLKSIAWIKMYKVRCSFAATAYTANPCKRNEQSRCWSIFLRSDDFIV